MRLVFLGLAGAGKGTQAQTLSERLGLALVSSGDLFRYHRANNTELGQIASVYVDKGELVPDDVTIRMILDRIGREDCRQGFILDGFPRTVAQAKALDEALNGAPVDKVMYIKVSEEELVRRLAGRVTCRQCNTPYSVDDLPEGATTCPKCSGQLYQRQDDDPQVVRQRIQVQWPEIVGLLDYYGRQCKLVEINGERPVGEVGEDLVSALA